MPRPSALTYDRGTLILHPPPRGKAWIDYATWDDRVERFRIPAIHYSDLVGTLTAEGRAFVDRAKQFSQLELTSQFTLKPYPHQQEALTAWQTSQHRGVVVLPTAAGKTYLALLAIQSADCHTAICVPTLDLMHQWYARLLEAFPKADVGLLGGGSRDRSAILVATYDSAAIHAETLGNQYGLLVFDECHHLPSDFNRVIAEYAIAPYRLGLTATPERADGRHTDLENLIGPEVYRKSAAELSGQALADYEIVSIDVELSPVERDRYAALIQTRNEFLRDSKIRLGSLQGWQHFVQMSARSQRGRQAMLAHREAKQIALGTEGKLRVLSDLLVRHHPESVLIFTNDNATVYRISQQFLIPAITHQTPVKERHDILTRFRDGTYRTLVVSHVLNEGVDVPEVKIAILLSGTGSTREYVQRLGRILRRSKDAGRRAVLYEVIAADTVEERTSQRRRGRDLPSRVTSKPVRRSPSPLKPVPNDKPARPTPKVAELPANWSLDDLPF
ncbi:MAG: DEAD/DEAH box helicase family protein [Cyanobacteria bacterium P01_D01_bin.123]